MFAEDIILKPVLTEKGYDGIADKKYTFIVKKTANRSGLSGLTGTTPRPVLRPSPWYPSSFPS